MDVDCPSLFSDFPVISRSDNILVQNFLGKQLNGQNGPDVKATIVQYSQVKPSDIKVIGMEDIHRAKYSTYFSMDQVAFQIENLNSDWLLRAIM